MRTRILQMLLALPLAAIAFCAPAPARAQTEVIPRDFVGPLSHPRYEDGGFYTGLEFLYMRQKQQVGNQNIAFRGFVDIDGSINPAGTPNTFVGSGAVALNTGLLDRNTAEPGFNLFMGYRFESGVTLEARWWHLADVRTSAAAMPIAPGYANGDLLENTVFFSPVVNVPPQFAGNPANLNVGNPGATYGIYNAYTYTQEWWVQRFDMVDLLARIPITETDNYRAYGTVGPRSVIMWERFKWRAIDASPATVTPGGGNTVLVGFGVGGPDTTADYQNVISQRFYGMVLGCGNEYRMGSTPIGTFSLFGDVNGALYGDFIKGRARYSLADKSIAFTYPQNLFEISPGFDARIGFQWYAYEAITVRLGFNYLGIFNTVASQNPVDFNIGGVHPSYQNNQFRYVYGLDFGIGLVW